MAEILENGIVRFADGRILYGDSVISGADYLELAQLLHKLNPLLGRGGGGFPSGGGGGAGRPGPAGTAGPPGADGSEGATGLQGVTGPGGGDPGVTGAPGATGLRGLTGSQGLTGLQGQTGLQGATGVQGPAGATGVQGLTGLRGLTGIQGATGVQGTTGAGVQGNTGSQGVTGVGVITAAIVTFTHLSGTASTGPLGFNPKFAIYSMAAANIGAGDDDADHSVGLIIGTGGNARSAGMSNLSGLSFLQGSAVVGDDSSAGGTIAPAGSGNVEIDTAWDTSLDVTAFSSLGIDLTWSAPVFGHRGQLLIVG